MAWLCKRLLGMSLSLLGITLLTFLVLDLAPVDRATIEVMRASADGTFVDAPAREAAIVRLRAHYGVIDAETLEPKPLPVRYAAWLANAACLEFGGPVGGQTLWSRFFAALPVSLLLGSLALGVALAVGIPLGLRAGFDLGGRCERWLRGGLLAAAGVPEYLVGTLLVLAFAGWQWNLLPSHGLSTPGSEAWSVLARLLDVARHLLLPTVVLAIGPAALVMRFVRDAAVAASRQPFAEHLVALGLEPEVIRRRLRRHALVPLATLAAGMLPSLVCGSVVVESLFSLNGVGALAFNAVRDQDQPMVMLVTVIVSIAVLVALLISDVLHRIVDPRVRLA
jgi:peptide/nickel transport system permease protein